MDNQQFVDQLNARLDAATTEIAKDMAELREEVKTGNVSAASLEKLDANIGKLEGFGRDPQNPIPDTPPTPPVDGGTGETGTGSTGAETGGLNDAASGDNGLTETGTNG